MLKGLANKDKAKKQPKKDGKTKKQVKQQKTATQDLEQDQVVDLVDASELKQDQNKVKQNTRKKNDYQLQQKDIDVSNLNLATTKAQKPKITSWVANSVDEVMKKDFKMEKVAHQFMSLTDQSLNQKLIKQKEQEQKNQKGPKITEQNNLKVAPIQKSKDQQKMDQADAQLNLKQSSNVTGGISTSGTPINFTNTNFTNNNTFKPIQKTAQQLKMQEMQKKEQQMALKKPTNSWIGAKKTDAQQKPVVFKQSAWAVSVDTPITDVGNTVKFAPLNANDLPKQPSKATTTTNVTTKQSGWATNNIQQSNGLKLAPIQLSKQQQKLQQSERKQQQFVFVSNKEKQQRKKKREERQKLQAGKEQPKI